MNAKNHLEVSVNKIRDKQKDFVIYMMESMRKETSTKIMKIIELFSASGNELR